MTLPNNKMISSKSLIVIFLFVAVLQPYLSSSLVLATKIDCYPLAGANKAECEARGCIWSPVEKKTASKEPKSRVDEPWCHYPESYSGYKITEVSESDNRIKLVRDKPSGLPDDIQELIVEVQEFKSLLRIRISDAKNKRFEPELPVLELENQESGGNELHYKFDIFGQLTISRKSTGAILFQTDLRKLIYTDKFIQLTSKLNSPLVYGLGEHFDTFLKSADAYKTYSFWNTDALFKAGGTRSYGGFPFYISFDSEKKHAHGVYLRNSNAMDIVLQPDPAVTFRPIGGIIELLIFSGPKPNDVIMQYQHAVGLPQLPPLWSLGFHLCRYNYGSLEKTKLVWQRTREAGIPFDVQWNDIDYMDKHNDFTYDNDKFAGLPEFVENLHKNNMHYVILFDPGLSQERNFYPYTLGEQMGIWIRNATNQTLVGKVWNDSGRTVFPDFSNPKTLDYWSQLFVLFQREVKFDGAWIDMNDISNFVDGSLDSCPNDNPLENPVYEPGGYKLQTKTLCLSAQHRAGSEYNVHNLYAFYEAIATYKALQAARPGKRPLIISRSSSPGQGHFGGHWSGDVLSNWEYLKWSIPSTIEHSMYGFSLIGTDICGFVGNTTPQLCARWSTLGAFYPFSRNHNDDTSIDQDPVALGPEVVDANRNALKKRYSLLPYLYSLIYRAHLYGEPVVRSVPFDFYQSDGEEVFKVEDAFMWGKNLMISPIVTENTYSKLTYLPKGRWYRTNVLPPKEQGAIKVPTVINSTGEWYTTTEVSLSDIVLFYRGGHITPVYADVKPTIAETTIQSMSLEVALCQMHRASGEIFLDDGENLDDKHSHLTLEFANNTLIIILDQDDYTQTISFDRVTVFGSDPKISKVKLDGKSLPYIRSDHVLVFDLNGAKVSKNKPLNIMLE